jgi:hypothetical protein
MECAISSNKPFFSWLNGECAASQMLRSIHILPSKPYSCRKASNGRYMDCNASLTSRLGRVTFRCRNSVTFVGSTKLNWNPTDTDTVLFGTNTGVWTAKLTCREENAQLNSHYVRRIIFIFFKILQSRLLIMMMIFPHFTRRKVSLPVTKLKCGLTI